MDTVVQHDSKPALDLLFLSVYEHGHMVLKLFQAFTIFLSWFDLHVMVLWKTVQITCII